MHRPNTTSSLRLGSHLTLTLTVAAALGATVLAGCNSDDDGGPPDTTSPGFSSFEQERTLDPSGQTITVTFDEPVTAASAEVIGNYTVSGGVNVTTAMLRSSGLAVDLALDAPAIPGDNTITVAAGIEDPAGNRSAEATSQALTSTDTTPPAAATVTGTTIPGAENDTIEVVFSDDMIPSEVTSLANWTIESPLGTTFDVTGASIAYDAMGRTATITLDAGATDQNLQTFDPIYAAFITMRDLGGNTIAATAIGVDAVNATVGGDTTPPTLLAAAPSGMDLVMTFSEDVTEVELADLGNPSAGATEIMLIDQDSGTPATGSVTITGTVADGDGVTISDGITSIDFEFDVATGSVSLSGLPTDADLITIDDGVTAVTFEFDDATDDGLEAGGDVEVQNDVDAAGTISRLRVAIILSDLDMEATINSGNPTILDLASQNTGTVANTVISVTQSGAVISKSDFTGGGTNPGTVPALINSDDVGETVKNLADEVNAVGYGVRWSTISQNSSMGTVSLRNSDPLSAGNVPITEVDTNNVMAISGMSGGVVSMIESPTASTVSGPLTARSTFSFSPDAGDLLQLYGVMDLAGNQMVPVLAEGVVAANANEPLLFLGASDITATSGENNDTVRVAFGSLIHPDGATDPANYTLNNGAPVDLSDATLTFNGFSLVTIQLGAASGVNIQAAAAYDLSANNLLSSQGVRMTAPSTENGIAPMGDTTAPNGAATSARIDAGSANAVILTFDEAVSATGAGDLNSYSLPGNATTAASMLHPRAVRVTFTTQPAVSDMITIAAAALTDLAGNAPGSTSTVAVTAADATAPMVTGVTATTGDGSERDQIEVTFDEPVDPTQATLAANYAVTSGSAISLAGAEISSSSVGNVVTIQLADTVRLDTGEMISVTASNVTDIAGNPVAVAASTAVIGGDTTAPTTMVAFTNFREDATGAIIDIQFDDTMDSTATLASVNWTGSNSQNALSVTPLTASLFRVVFSAPIAPTDTISLVNPTDRANNEGSTITVSPLE